MPLFSSPQKYLGIDFDSNGVKVVELKNESGRPKLVTYGYYDREMDKSIEEKDKAGYLEMARLIKMVCREAKTTTTKAITSLPAYSVFSSILNLPAMSPKDLPSAIKWEAKKVVPLPIDDMILDWKILPENVLTGDGTAAAAEETGDNNTGEVAARGFLKISQADGKKFVRVLLTAAPKDLVKRYIDIFKAAGLNLLSLDTEQFALVRSLIGSDRSSLMIADVGSVVTNISIISDNVPILNRSIDVGGLTITKSIASSLNINLSRAEQFKHDIGMNSQRVGEGSVPKTIEATLAPIVDEIKYSLNIYKGQGIKNIEKLILTGGSSLLPNLPEYLSNVLGLRVFLGDPWARVIYPEELKPVLDGVGPRFSVAIGLAMRDIE